MSVERVERVVGGREHSDVKALEQRPRTICGLVQPRGYGVEDLVGIRGGQLPIDPEHGRKFLAQPV